MGGCSFPNCHNSSEKGFKVLRFPRCLEIRNKWVIACKILKPCTENSRLCEGHFSKELFDIEGSNYKLKRNMVPDILIPSPDKPFCASVEDDYPITSKRRKSGVSELTEQQQVEQLLKENTSLKNQILKMISCAVYGCTNSSATIAESPIQFYYFPKHPVIIQQWVTACWRPDLIDINNARICSIHFDDDCFTSEYKLVNYLGHYTRILKYNAIPTLYLPQPQPTVTTSETAQPMVTIHATEINPEDIKDIIVYEFENVSNELPTPNFEENYILPKQETETENSNYEEQYNEVNNREKLVKLQTDNSTMQQQILKLQASIETSKALFDKKITALRAVDEEIKQVSQEYDKLNRKRLSMVDQQSILSKVFSESQIKILSGKKKIYWSNDDLAVGYTIRHLSNKRCYMYLTKNLKIPLPATSSIKRWSTLKTQKKDKDPEESEDKEDEDIE